MPWVGFGTGGEASRFPGSNHQVKASLCRKSICNCVWSGGREGPLGLCDAQRLPKESLKMRQGTWPACVCVGGATAGVCQPWGQASSRALCAARPACPLCGTGASGRRLPEQAEASSRCLSTWLRLGSPFPAWVSSPGYSIHQGSDS